MLRIIKTEFMKMKRYNVLWLGIVSILFSIILAAFQLTGTKGSIITYTGLAEGVIWNHFSLFLPFTCVLLVGYFINREYTDSTIKNILVIPISRFRTIMAKLTVGYIVILLECLFSFFITLLIGFLLKCQDISLITCIVSLKQLFIVSSCSYISVLPIIVITTRKQDKFLSGVAFAFVYGFCGIFVANGPLINLYPATTGLVLSGYPHGNNVVYMPAVSIIVLLTFLLASFLLLYLFSQKNNDL